jgi:hypothetical protein
MMLIGFVLAAKGSQLRHPRRMDRVRRLAFDANGRGRLCPELRE